MTSGSCLADPRQRHIAADTIGRFGLAGRFGGFFVLAQAARPDVETAVAVIGDTSRSH
ncbi:MAG TPA: hypothetical protein VEL06_08450 [Haliangiales bacterium]|nr:hypothetical protein [Haliangiales bacterium]